MKIAFAYALALPIGWDRERATHGAGIRTFPLVAASSCAFVLIALRALGPSAGGHANVIQGLLTGIGFLGAGAIMKQGSSIHGTATAASIWSVSALGAAVGYGAFEIATFLAVVNFVTLRWLVEVKRQIDKEPGSGE
ncbi:MAG: MgtC/SapB family protein [Bryobacterales bacterium]|nr:MgtC/SapB family protein [Bryobacterales bacterium]